jgi:hypothetical protein
MKRQTSRAWLGLLVVLVFGCALQPEGSESTGTSVRNPEQSKPRAQQQRARRQQAEPEEPHLAFDVVSRNHRRTTRYVLEIVDSAGAKTVLDLKKPRLRRGPIMVPLPDLAPGKYTFAVIAETDGGPLRSAEITYELKTQKKK